MLLCLFLPSVFVVYTLYTQLGPDYMDRASPATRANPVERDKLFSQLYRYRTDPASRAENWRVSRENFASKFEIVNNKLKLWSLYSTTCCPV